MKHLLSLISLLLACGYIQAQDTDYRPFIEEGKVWEVGHFLAFTEKTNRGSMYYFDGDTVVADRNCKRWMCDGRLLAPVYEQDRKVYFFPKDSKSPRLLYDFSVVENDSVLAYELNGMSAVCYIDKVGKDKAGRRIITLYDSEALWAWDELYQPNGLTWEDFKEDYCYVWLEGIGTTTSPDYNIGLGGIEGNWSILTKVRVEDSVIYEDSFFKWIHDDVSTPHNSKSSTLSSSWHTLSGHRLTTPPTRKGVYIRGGKKVLIK